MFKRYADLYIITGNVHKTALSHTLFDLQCSYKPYSKFKMNYSSSEHASGMVNRHTGLLNLSVGFPPCEENGTNLGVFGKHYEKYWFVEQT